MRKILILKIVQLAKDNKTSMYMVGLDNNNNKI